MLCFLPTNYGFLTSVSSISNTNAALAGIPEPAGGLTPYARSAGIINLLVPPTFIPGTPSVQPLITPSRLNGIGLPLSWELWNIIPVDATAPV